MMYINGNWLLASVAAFLYCINQWMAVNGIHWLTALTALLLLAATIPCAFDARARRFLPYICFISLFGFPEYSADPYLLNYIAPFSLAKIPALISMLLMLHIRFNVIGILVAILLFSSTLGAVLLGRFGAWDAEVWYAALLLLALNASSPLSDQAKSIWLGALELLFYLLLPIALFSGATGLYEQRSADTTTYFYGHWIGIITTLAIYRATTGESRLFFSNIFRLPLIVVIVYICSASYQSAHFILFIAAAAMAALKNIAGRANSTNIAASFTMLLAIPISGYIVLSQSGADSWLYLKVSQIFALATGGFLEASNSVTIRVAQFISMFEQSSLFSILGGRGMASTYRPEGPMWEFVIFHEATYPAEQLASGKLQYIHEPITMLIKWIGLVGTTLVLYAIFKKVHIARSLISIEGLLALMFLLLFASSLHTGIIVTLLVIFGFGATGRPKMAAQKILENRPAWH